MSSHFGGTDIDIEVRRRNNKYLLIARRFGVVVRAKELETGVKELDRRIAIIGDDFREAGIPVPLAPDPEMKSGTRLVERLAPSLIVAVAVAAVLASFLYMAHLVTGSIAGAVAAARTEVAGVRAEMAAVRTEMAKLIPAEARTGIAGAGRLGIDFIVAVSQVMDQVTPQRREELRSAIRKIAREVDLIIQDANPEQPALPQPTAEPSRRAR